MLRIHRSHPDEGFTIIPNGALQDERLTWAARGLLFEILSRPEGWETNADALWSKARRSRSSHIPEGREVVRRLIAELEQLGYIVRSKVQVERGRFVTVVDAFDTAGHTVAELHRGTASRASGGRASADRASDIWASKERTEQQRTEEKGSREKDSSSLADARAAAASASARNRSSERDQLYNAVDRLDHETLRNALLAFENKRPRIYRQTRRDTAGQLKRESPGIIKEKEGSLAYDRLSYKYAIKHYFETADDWPAWLIRPLGYAPPLRRAA